MAFAIASPIVAALPFQKPVKKTTTKKVAPKKGLFAPKKGRAAPKKGRAAPAGGKRSGNVGPNRTLWLPNAESPAYLDGSLPGDAGFDPWSLSAPTEYLQFGLDALDQNKAENPSGNIIGKLKKVDNAPTQKTIVPFNEAFDILRFRECELLHSRWAMLGLVGAVIAEANTGISWADAGKVELEQPQYLGAPIPLSVSTLTLIEVLAMGYLEFARSAELDQEKRCYPGGYFDPFGLADDGEEDAVFKLKTAELKHGRLAMVGMLGIAIQAGVTDTTSPLENLANLGKSG